MLEENFKPKTLRELKEFDTFIISESFFSGKYPIPKEYIMKPVFKEGVLKIISPNTLLTNKDDVFYVYLNDETGVVETYVYSRENYKFNYFFRTKLIPQEIRNNKTVDFDIDNKFAHMGKKEIEVFFRTVVIEAMAYLSYIIENKETKVKYKKSPNKSNVIDKENKSVSKENKRKKVQVLNDGKVVYEIDTTNNNLLKSLRAYQKHTDSWNVIGHKRVYKSGKEIWVNPYTKGTTSGKVEKKQFIIK